MAAPCPPLLPGKSGDPGRSGTDHLAFVNGVLWVLRSGAHWHDLPEHFGKWKTAHKRFTRWAKAGVWEQVFADLIIDPDNEYVSLDSSLVRAHQQAATGKGGGQNVWPAPSASGTGSAGLSSLHKRIRPSGEPLAKMEIRASWAS